MVISFFTAFLYKFTLKFFYPLKYENEVYQASETYGVDKELIFAIIKCESGFESNAHSKANAFGLMQLTPETFSWLTECYTHEEKLSVINLIEPKINISYGTLLISILSKKYKDENVILSAYNAGIATVDRWLKDKNYSSDKTTLDYIPYKETRNYVEKVKRAKKIYKKLYFK